MASKLSSFLNSFPQSPSNSNSESNRCKPEIQRSPISGTRSDNQNEEAEQRSDSCMNEHRKDDQPEQPRNDKLSGFLTELRRTQSMPDIQAKRGLKTKLTVEIPSVGESKHKANRIEKKEVLEKAKKLVSKLKSNQRRFLCESLSSSLIDQFKSHQIPTLSLDWTEPVNDCNGHHAATGPGDIQSPTTASGPGKDESKSIKATTDNMIDNVLPRISVEDCTINATMKKCDKVRSPSDVRKLFCEQRRLKIGEVVALLERGRKILLQEENIIEVKAPINVCGDVHGQFFDLLDLFRHGGEIEKGGRYLFLGDYVDRGPRSCEVFLYLLSLKVRFPHRVFLLRGNHETLSVSTYFGFKEECKEKYGLAIYHKFIHCFQALPLAAKIHTKNDISNSKGDEVDPLLAYPYFALHGGLSPGLQTLRDVASINRLREPPESGLMCDLLWADPLKGSTSKCPETPDNDVNNGRSRSPKDEDAEDMEDILWLPNDARGCSFLFNVEATKRFLTKNKLRGIIRAHELQPDGFSRVFPICPGGEAKVVTVFSAPNYCGRYENTGAFLRVQREGGHLEFIQFQSVERPETDLEINQTNQHDALYYLWRRFTPYLPTDFVSLLEAARKISFMPEDSDIEGNSGSEAMLERPVSLEEFAESCALTQLLGKSIASPKAADDTCTESNASTHIVTQTSRNTAPFANRKYYTDERAYSSEEEADVQLRTTKQNFEEEQTYDMESHIVLTAQVKPQTEQVKNTSADVLPAAQIVEESAQKHEEYKCAEGLSTVSTDGIQPVLSEEAPTAALEIYDVLEKEPLMGHDMEAEKLGRTMGKTASISEIRSMWQKSIATTNSNRRILSRRDSVELLKQQKKITSLRKLFEGVSLQRQNRKKNVARQNVEDDAQAVVNGPKGATWSVKCKNNTKHLRTSSNKDQKGAVEAENLGDAEASATVQNGRSKTRRSLRRRATDSETPEASCDNLGCDVAKVELKQNKTGQDSIEPCSVNNTNLKSTTENGYLSAGMGQRRPKSGVLARFGKRNKSRTATLSGPIQRPQSASCDATASKSIFGKTKIQEDGSQTAVAGLQSLKAFFTSYEAAAIVLLFRIMDRRSKDRITAQDLKDFAEETGCLANEEELEECMFLLDFDKDGALDVTDFLSFVLCSRFEYRKENPAE